MTTISEVRATERPAAPRGAPFADAVEAAQLVASIDFKLRTRVRDGLYEVDAVSLRRDGVVFGSGRGSLRGDAVSIDLLNVGDDYRFQGVGTSVLNWIEDRARQDGARYAVVQPRLNAIGFYEKNGYHFQSERPGSLPTYIKRL